MVDDAIVVGENIYRHFEMGKSGLQAAVDGARQVATPVTFSILTTLAAFSPLLFIPGPPGEMMKVIPIIVLACLGFSLIESVFILPNHLSHLSHRKEDHEPSGISRYWYRFQGRFTKRLTWVIEEVYRPSLDRFIEWRYATVAESAGAADVDGRVRRGRLGALRIFPERRSRQLRRHGDHAAGHSGRGHPARPAHPRAGGARGSARRSTRETGQDPFRHIMATVGGHPFAEKSEQMGPAMGGIAVTQSSAHLGEVNIELLPAEVRQIRSTEITNRWRELTGLIAGAEELSFSASLISFGSALDVQLIASDIEQLRQASEAVKRKFLEYPGVSDVTDSYQLGKREIEIDIHPRGEALGLSLGDLGRQVRPGFLWRRSAANPTRARRRAGHGALPGRRASDARLARADARARSGCR